MKEEKKIKKVPFFIITGFVILFCIGIALGEPKRVLDQAKQVCLSCIGIG